MDMLWLVEWCSEDYDTCPEYRGLFQSFEGAMKEVIGHFQNESQTRRKVYGETLHLGDYDEQEKEIGVSLETSSGLTEYGVYNFFNPTVEP